MLRFRESPNFEAPDRQRRQHLQRSPSLPLTGPTADTENVEIEVTNVDEPGTVTLSTLQPQVGVPLTASLSDSDVVSGTETWMWFRGSSAIVNATNADVHACDWRRRLQAEGEGDL